MAHDYISTYGTAVGHDGQNRDELRTKETWILAGEPGSDPVFEETTIKSGRIMVQIRFPSHNSPDPKYVECAPSSHRGRPSTPRKKLRALTVLPWTARGGLRPPEWFAALRKEFSIMNRHPHNNIVEVFQFREAPAPTIYMAYCADGNMSDVSFDEAEYVTAFGQILDGVKHRDLKPENLLVQKTPVFKVVFADFGLSKIVIDTTVLLTICGTIKYTAPEVFPCTRLDYDLSVNVWSLGVIVFEGIYGIPEPKRTKGGAEVTRPRWGWWANNWRGQLRVLSDLEENDKVVKILCGVIVRDSTQRQSADQCLETGFRDRLWKRRDSNQLVIVACEGGGVRDHS
ncbi:kinase-like domain-containing protein [Xylaria longipes]|nr:kinase-like domain-containing protein [Xylaria longipes]